MRRLRSWQRVALGLLLALLLAAAVLWWSTTALVVELVTVPIADLPDELVGLRIALLSDFHGRRLPPDGQLVRAVQEAGVDLVAAVGDFIDHDVSEMASVLPVLQSLAQVAPVYAVSGNHDYWADWPALAQTLSEAGITVLENSSLLLQRGGATYCLAGIADHYSGHADLAQALLDDWSGLTILLSHSPTLFEPDIGDGYLTNGGSDWPDRQRLLQRVALTLSGHTHGGQIKLPLIGAVTNGSGQLFPKQHLQGLSWEGSGWLYITRGLGTTGIVRARWLARPELTILTLQAGE